MESTKRDKIRIRRSICARVMTMTSLIVLCVMLVSTVILRHYMGRLTESIMLDVLQPIAGQAANAVSVNIHLMADRMMGLASDGRLTVQNTREEDMEEVLEAVVLGRACRNAAAIKNRQPIARMYVKMGAGGQNGSAAAADSAKGTVGLDSFYTTIILDELNVKEVVYTEDVRDYTTYTFKPQLRTVGPKYGKQLGGIQKTLAALDGNAAMDELNKDGKLSFEVNGANVELTKDDLLIDMTQKPGYVSQENGKMTVVLDANLTEELIEEGFVYELISKIQTMRKDAGFEVMDHIKVSVNGNEKLAAIAADNKDSISGKVLAEELTSGADFAVAKEWNVNGEKAIIAIEKI